MSYSDTLLEYLVLLMVLFVLLGFTNVHLEDNSSFLNQMIFSRQPTVGSNNDASAIAVAPEVGVSEAAAARSSRNHFEFFGVSEFFGQGGKSQKSSSAQKSKSRKVGYNNTNRGIPSPKFGAVEAFRNHPSHIFLKTTAAAAVSGTNTSTSTNTNTNNTLVDYMVYLATLPQCQKKPLFVSMARVQTDLYWQLIENFFYTMFMFGHLDCAVMVCVTDPLCMKRCRDHDFPCFDYRHRNESDHVMEQVAEVKLLHIGNALAAGANIMLLDLDVGFLRDPLILYEGFLENSLEQVRAQMDMGFSTEKFSNTWYTHPRTNFGKQTFVC